MLGVLLIAALLVLLVFSLPTWPHSRNWGLYPSGGFGVVLLILVILGLMERLPFLFS